MFQYTFKIINAILYTIRPSATLGACLLVLAAFDPQKNELNKTVTLLMAAFFGSAYCFVLNDIYDRKKDLFNNKLRPIATGVLPLNIAIGFCILCICVFLLVTWSIGQVVFLLSFTFLLFASIYPLINHKSGIWANVVVAFIVSGTQWGVAFLKPDLYLLSSSLFLFFFSIPREVLLDWLDQAGDKRSGKRSLPLAYSPSKIKLGITIMLVLASLSILFPLFIKESTLITKVLLVIVAVTSWISFLPFYRKTDDKHALRSVRISHVSFAFLILALLAR